MNTKVQPYSFLTLGPLLTLLVFWTSFRDLEHDTVRIYAAMVIRLSERGRSLDRWHPGVSERP
jgi:hypothetical protein